MKRTLLPLLLLAAASGCFGQTETVDQIVAKHVAARGGAAKIAAIHAVRIEGRIKLSSSGSDAAEFTPLTVITARPDKFHLEFKSSGSTIEQGYDGKTPWASMGAAGKQAATGDTATLIVDQASSGVTAGVLVDYRERGVAVTLGGRQKWKDRDTIRIKVMLKTGTTMNIYLDSKTYLEVGEELFVKIAGKPTTIEETVGDDRAFGGVLFPCLFQSHVVGQPGGQRMEFQNIVINPKIDDTIFQIKAQLKARP